MPNHAIISKLQLMHTNKKKNFILDKNSFQKLHNTSIEQHQVFVVHEGEDEGVIGDKQLWFSFHHQSSLHNKPQKKQCRVTYPHKFTHNSKNRSFAQISWFQLEFCDFSHEQTNISVLYYNNKRVICNKKGGKVRSSRQTSSKDIMICKRD